MGSRLECAYLSAVAIAEQERSGRSHGIEDGSQIGCAGLEVREPAACVGQTGAPPVVHDQPSGRREVEQEPRHWFVLELHLDLTRLRADVCHVDRSLSDRLVRDEAPIRCRGVAGLGDVHARILRTTPAMSVPMGASAPVAMSSSGLWIAFLGEASEELRASLASSPVQLFAHYQSM